MDLARGDAGATFGGSDCGAMVAAVVLKAVETKPK